MSDEELTQAMTDAVIFGTGVMQDGKRIDPLSFFVQPVSDPACEHCGMDPAALTEQLEAARADAKKAEAYAEELEAMNKNQEAMIRQADRRGDALETKLAECEARLGKAVEALREIADAFGCECGDAARAALAEIEGINAP
jgi:nucleotide-binding universal stress UspA family protein